LKNFSFYHISPIPSETRNKKYDKKNFHKKNEKRKQFKEKKISDIIFILISYSGISDEFLSSET